MKRFLGLLGFAVIAPLGGLGGCADDATVGEQSAEASSTTASEESDDDPGGTSTSGGVGDTSNFDESRGEPEIPTGGSDGSSSSEGDASSSEGDGSSSGGSSGEGSSSSGVEDACLPPVLAEQVILDCELDAGYTVGQYRADTVGAPTVHAIGLYETHYFGHDAPITWNLPGDNRLVLTTQAQSAQWLVQLGPLGELDEVHVFDGGTVTAPLGVTVVSHGPLNPNYGPCYDLPDAQQDDCNALAIRDAAQLALGTEVHSVDYCYQAQNFEFEPSEACGGTPGAAVPQCDLQAGPSGALQGTCDSITAEAVHCLFVDDTQVRIVGFQTGNYCTMDTEYSDLGFGEGGLGWIADDVYYCAGTVRVVHLADGSVEDSGFGCEMVTDYQGGILVRGSYFDGPYGFSEVVHFAGWDELVADTPLAVYPIDGLFGLSMATDGDALYSAWFYATKSDHWDLLSGAHLPDAPYGCWDGWIGGVDVLDGTTYVFGDNENVLKAFDAATGEFQSQVDLPGIGAFQTGVACRSSG